MSRRVLMCLGDSIRQTKVQGQILISTENSSSEKVKTQQILPAIEIQLKFINFN